MPPRTAAGTGSQSYTRMRNVLAHRLGKETIAEFVENGETLKKLYELNIDCAQGYYLGKPSASL
ncbi:MAG: EAL domain-containing protein [Firmicutes bacterium]|nr:EAL domain-containing protein [Bacillota bacterium]